MVVSAGMGKGHNSAALGLSRLLTAAGHQVRTVDLLGSMRFGYGRLIDAVYHAQLRYAPWTYQAIYSAWREHPSLVRGANGVDTIAARRSLVEQARAFRPGAIISTYNLASQVLGELSISTELGVPIYSFVTDFGVHPYWIHEGVSGYLTVHESTARAVRELTGAPVGVCGPLVDPSFLEVATSSSRGATRRSLGVGDHHTMVLIVAGGWGVGHVKETFMELESRPDLSPIVVCGTNRRLYRQLRSSVVDTRRLIGLTDQMPGLMEAADVLVENAGGMTCFEAFASGLPVVTYRPIPGHGIDNARAMAAAGVTTFAHNHAQLTAAIDALKPGGAGRAHQTQVASQVFPPDPTAVILELIDHGRRLVEDHGLTGSP